MPSWGCPWGLSGAELHTIWRCSSLRTHCFTECAFDNVSKGSGQDHFDPKSGFCSMRKASMFFINVPFVQQRLGVYASRFVLIPSVVFCVDSWCRNILASYKIIFGSLGKEWFRSKIAGDSLTCSPGSFAAICVLTLAYPQFWGGQARGGAAVRAP